MTLGDTNQTAKDRQKVKKCFDWTLNSRQLVSDVIVLHTEWMAAWDRFSGAEHGHIAYFRGGTHETPENVRLLDEIRDNFELIRDLKTDLETMKDRCNDYYKDVCSSPSLFLLSLPRLPASSQCGRRGHLTRHIAQLAPRCRVQR